MFRIRDIETELFFENLYWQKTSIRYNVYGKKYRYNAYLSILQIAIDSNDPQLPRKIRRRWKEKSY